MVMNCSPKRASRHDDDGDMGGDDEGDVEEEEGDDDFAHPRGQVDIADYGDKGSDVEHYIEENGDEEDEEEDDETMTCSPKRASRHSRPPASRTSRRRAPS